MTFVEIQLLEGLRGDKRKTEQELRILGSKPARAWGKSKGKKQGGS